MQLSQSTACGLHEVFTRLRKRSSARVRACGSRRGLFSSALCIAKCGPAAIGIQREQWQLSCPCSTWS